MWPYPTLLAHRGAGILAPENTIAALRHGLARGFHAVEFDAMLAADGVPVLMHDPYFGRTVAGRGDIAHTSSIQLAAMDAGSWLHPDFAGEPVPTLRQALQFCLAHGIWPNIEIKPFPGQDADTGNAVAETLRAVLAETPSAGAAPLISSFSLTALLAARDVLPTTPRALLVETVPVDWQQQLEACGAIALHAWQEPLTEAQAGSVKAAGYGLFCYTVNDVSRARQLLSWGVDAFCTDRLDLFAPDFADRSRR